MVVTKLGSGYKAKSCATVSANALDLIESKPGSYRVWVDTKAIMASSVERCSPAWPTCRGGTMTETHAEDSDTREDRGTRKVGKTVPGVVLGGVSSLQPRGKAGWGKISAVIAPFENAIPLIPTHGWRIYAVSGSLPKFDPKTWEKDIQNL